jgi:hypothetical protein
VGNDVFRAWDVVAVSCVIAMIVGLIYLITFRFPGVMAWCIGASCIATLFLLLIAAFLLYTESSRVYDLIQGDFYDVDMEQGERDVNTRIY